LDGCREDAGEVERGGITLVAVFHERLHDGAFNRGRYA
jgi:hypothetical protein